MNAEKFATVEEVAQLRAEIAELKLSGPCRGRFKPTPTRMLLALVLFAIPLLHAAVPHTFTAGTAAVAADMNANLTYLDEISVPVGGIIGWHKSFAGVPALPASGKWVECNGQVLADAGSPLNNQTIPNLNGEAGGADSPGHAAKVAMFLRGGVTSGTGQQDAFQGHWHDQWEARMDFSTGGAGFGYISSGSNNINNTADNSIRNAISDGTNDTPRTANETRPSNMAVVWIVRVK